LYRKAAGAWSYFSKLLADSTKMHDSTFWQGSIVKIRDWNTLGQDWNTIAIQRNQNSPGNNLLTYKDDPVVINGWNVDQNGARVDGTKAYHIWQHEGNYQTNPFFAVPYYEDHISLGFVPGSQAANWFTNASTGVIRVESWLSSQTTPDVYKYNTKSYEFWQWADSGKLFKTYFLIQPTGINYLTKSNVDSVRAGTAFYFVNNNAIGQLDSVGTRAWYTWNRSGFNDTARLNVTGGGNFVFNVKTGTQNMAIDAAAVAIGGNTVSQTTSPFWVNNIGTLQLNSASGKNFLYNNDGTTSGIGINTTARLGHSYLDIRNSDLGQYFNMLFKGNSTFADSAVNGIHFNIQKSYFGSYTNAALTGTYGWKLNLNSNEYGNGGISSYYTKFNGNQDGASRYLSDFTWATEATGGSTLLDRMTLNNVGNLLLGRTTDTLTSRFVNTGKSYLGDSVNLGVVATGTTADSILTIGSNHYIHKLAFSAFGGGGSGVSRVSPLDSMTKDAKGIQISGINLVPQSADASFAGLVTTGTQTFAGAKTFTTAPILTSSSTVGQVWTASGTGGQGGWATVNNIYTTDGTLTANRALSGATFNLSLGTNASKLGQLDVYAPIINLRGSQSFYGGNPSDANLTVADEGMLYLLPPVTANRTITLPSVSNYVGRILVFPNANTSGTFNWSFASTVINPDGSSVTGLTNGYTYILQSHGTYGWVVVSRTSSSSILSGSVSQVGTATTTFTVPIGITQANTSYKVNVTPTSALAAALFYVSNKTTTTFDVVYLAGLTGTVTFDWSLFP
jgi:hypothetical protein